MLEYFLCLDLLMLTRLVYLRKDEAIGIKWTLWLTGLQLVLVILCFSFNTALWLVVLVLVVAGILNLVVEPGQRKKGWRIVTLLILVFGLDIVLGMSAGLQLRPALVSAFAFLTSTSGLLQISPDVSGEKLLGIIFGLLVLTNEINLFIRMVFHHFGMEPGTEGEGQRQATDASAHGIDRQEYNTGRVIGILERWLMYLVVLSTNNLAAIGFIIAAKGLARMKQLDDKTFAEYMLIGTLLSMLSAVLMGSWVLLL
jgi:hypothetical protein